MGNSVCGFNPVLGNKARVLDWGAPTLPSFQSVLNSRRRQVVSFWVACMVIDLFAAFISIYWKPCINTRFLGYSVLLQFMRCSSVSRTTQCNFHFYLLFMVSCMVTSVVVNHERCHRLSRTKSSPCGVEWSYSSFWVVLWILVQSLHVPVVPSQCLLYVNRPANQAMFVKSPCPIITVIFTIVQVINKA